MSQPRILIVHPEPASLALLSSMLKSLGHPIDEAPNDRAAVKLLERGGVDMVLAGVDPVDPEALELLTYVRRKYRQVPVILLFPGPCPERAKEALRMGALSVLRYPLPATELRAAVTQALGTVDRPAAGVSTVHATSTFAGSAVPNAVSSNGDSAHARMSSAPTGQVPALVSAPPRTRAEQVARTLGLIGGDSSLRLALEMAGTIAPTRTPVLIVGERGTGKSLLARTIHDLGSRADGPFVTIDAAALSAAEREREGDDEDDDQSESEDGGPTGSERDPEPAPALLPSASGFDWASKLAQAQGGTLFVKEVAALSDALQVQLLRALQDRPDASNDVRVLMSTSENLVPLVEQEKFRQDLYYRASIITLKLSPLRHRGSDLELISDALRTRFSREFGKNIVGFTRDALEALIKYEWPGNVRELEGVIHRGVALCQGTRITSGHLAPSLGHARSSPLPLHVPRSHMPQLIRPLKEALEEPEKRIIIQALQALNWNRQETARVLNINRTTLYKKMKKYGLLIDEPIWVN